MKAININPEFDDLQQHETLLNHVQEITKPKATPHADILNKLLEQIEPIDFKVLAFPEIEKLNERLNDLSHDSDEAQDIKKRVEKLKVKNHHYLVIAIENVLKVAKNNHWGLCKNHDFIYLFNGMYWSELDKETFQKFLGEATEKMGVDKFNARYFQFKELLYKQFLGTAYLPTPETDKDTVLINLQNGTFEVDNKGTRLRLFDQSDFIIYQLPFEYEPKATAPLFQKYLDEVLPDKDRQKVLAEYLGFIFIKHGSNRLKEEKALILYGTGANGKSVFFEVVSALLGTENTSNYSLQSLTNENGYFRAKLANKLVNYGSEINGKLESSLFKQLVSGEPVEARLPYGQPFILKQYAKLIFNSNELPKDVEHTNAYFRRFLIIPFDVTIPPQEQDKQLHTKIIEKELSGVFNWVLDGLNRLLQQKRFTDCEAVKQAVEQYKSQSDSVKMFIDDNEYKPSSDAPTKIIDLYREYKAYCIDDGFKPVNKTNFKKRLLGYGVVIDKVGSLGWCAYLSNGKKPF